MPRHVSKSLARNDSKLPGSGCLLIGDKGHLFSPDDYGARFFLLPQKEFAEYKNVEERINSEAVHHKEWIDACKGGKPGGSNFDWAGPLAETVLLGNVALRVQLREDMTRQKLLWDPANLRISNLPEANQFLRRVYRDGWTL